MNQTLLWAFPLKPSQARCLLALHLTHNDYAKILTYIGNDLLEKGHVVTSADCDFVNEVASWMSAAICKRPDHWSDYDVGIFDELMDLLVDDASRLINSARMYSEVGGIEFIKTDVNTLYLLWRPWSDYDDYPLSAMRDR